ncbi:von Willebrand factor A-like protein [Gracilaria domingensis]|nr:von Willebrand factor A-like protein [Gracilaria domingensis]
MQSSSQKEFVTSVTRALHGKGDIQLAAVQYGFITLRISNLTRDVEVFLQRLDESEFENDSTTFLGGAIAYCDLELAFETRRNLVVLGDGRSTLFDPVQNANMFRERGGNVFAVAVGTPDMESILGIVGGSRSRVFDLTDAEDTNAVVVAAVNALCRMGYC